MTENTRDTLSGTTMLTMAGDQFPATRWTLVVAAATASSRRAGLRWRPSARVTGIPCMRTSAGGDTKPKRRAI